MTKTNHITCIIPFYNENPRIFSVVEAISKVESVSQIICVDDGSEDGASDTLKSKLPNIELIRLDKNVGKTGAIFAALPSAENENILLMDGDLFNIKPNELENAFVKFFDNSLDMLILRAHGEEKYKLTDNIVRHYLVLSGIRVMKKSDLEAIRSYDAVGYQIEVAINKYMMENNKKTGWVRFSALNLRKDQKYTRLYGYKRDLFMHLHIIIYVGLWQLLKQYTSFCRQEIV